jgi:hypothetical protein
MSSLISVDQRLIALLPTRSRLKLGRLVQSARDAESNYQSAIRQGEAMREDIGAVEDERRQIIANANAVGNDEPNTADVDAAIAQLQGELARIDQQRDKRAERRYAEAQLIARLRHALEQVPAGTVLVHAQQVSPKLNPGESAVDGVNRIRGEISKLQNELRATAMAPLPTGELKQKARAWIGELSKAAIPMLMVERGQFEVRFPPGCLANGPMAPAALPLFAWLFGDVLIARLDEIIEQTVKGTGLSERERPGREADIGQRIHALEVMEEAIIEADDGNNDSWGIVRRVDADPMAVLGVRHAMAAKVA